MIVLLTGGFDLAVGTTIALTSVVSALAMIALASVMPDIRSGCAIIAVGCLVPLAVALLIGLVNGTGVAVVRRFAVHHDARRAVGRRGRSRCSSPAAFR